MSDSQPADRPLFERVQIGVRIEKRMVKVLKGLAEALDVSMGDLLEGIVLHAFENKTPFTAETLKRVEQLKAVYGMDYGTEAAHSYPEDSEPGKGERTR